MGGEKTEENNPKRPRIKLRKKEEEAGRQLGQRKGNKRNSPKGKHKSKQTDTARQYPGEISGHNRKAKKRKEKKKKNMKEKLTSDDDGQRLSSVQYLSTA